MRYIIFAWFLISIPGFFFTQSFMWREFWFEGEQGIALFNIVFIVTNALSVGLLFDSRSRRGF
jgi:hypothetical protein